MRRPNDLTFLLIYTSLLTSNALDTMDASHVITENETLVSSDGVFELGFFSPGNSKNRYIGIWYRKIPSFTVVWVANRDHPITNASEAPLLKFTQPGILALMANTSSIVWSTTSSQAAQNPVAQLLDTGNLVLREPNDADPENYLWQSFDYPTDTLLAGMKFGKNLETGRENYISSWKSSDDPGTGDYTYHLDPTGYPQTILRRGSTELFRTGPWNGVGYSGMPGLKKNSIYSFEVVINATEVYYHYWLLNKSVVSRFVMNASGSAQRWTWVDRTQGWVMYLNAPIDNCDTYKSCGAYGSCNVGNSPVCGCLPNFVPRYPEELARADWSNGCTRRTPLDCKTDGFKQLSDMKLPDTNYSRFNASMSLKECREVCLRDCSCMAYTSLDIRNGGSGCLLWFGELLDIRVVYGAGQDIYIRLASSELDTGRKKNRKLIAGLTTLMGMIFVGMGLTVYICKKKQIYLKLRQGGAQKEDPELPSFHLTTLSRATNSFSLNNKLGEGGFGPVYKGTLEDGREIAVKRLSKTSMQGADEFKNEVIFIAKLQHRNLVKLLGCCIQGHENMLVYEYLPNKSLDLILFDEIKSKVLDWPKRFKIINGIARGLMYLHQDSRLRVIHRDLKASNILLDSDMNPKISDFGMARTFGGNEIEANTSRVVGTFGYMSPEYVVDGLFSVKSDVFSFGVIMLEILSGKRNRGFCHEDHDHNLVGHAWLLYKEERSLEVIDMNGVESCYWSAVERLIHVGLLCVQKYPEDRPSMSTVVIMLENKEVGLPKANEPGFFTERDAFGSTSTHATSTNEITITVLESR